MGTIWTLLLFQEQNSHQSGTDFVLEPSFLYAGKCCVTLVLCSVCRLSGLELSCVELGAVFAWELLPKGPRHVPMLPWCNQLQLWQEVVRASCCVPLLKLLKSVHFLINRPFLVIWELETAMNMEEGWSSCGAPMV